MKHWIITMALLVAAACGCAKQNHVVLVVNNDGSVVMSGRRLDVRGFMIALAVERQQHGLSQITISAAPDCPERNVYRVLTACLSSGFSDFHLAVAGSTRSVAYHSPTSFPDAEIWLDVPGLDLVYPNVRIILGLGKTGVITVNGMAPATNTAEEIASVCSRASNNVPVLLACEPNSAHGQLVDLLALCVSNGVRNLRIISDEPSELRRIHPDPFERNGGRPVMKGYTAIEYSATTKVARQHAEMK